MADDIVLKFEIVEGEVPNAENVARALLAYIDMLKVAGSVVDPNSQLEVGLAGVEDGSDVFRLRLRRLEAFATTVKAGMDEYPLVSKAVIALAGLITSTVIVLGVTDLLTEDPRIPEDQMAVFEEQRDLLRQSVELQREQNRFFGILHEEPAIERMDVLRSDRSLVYSIPREDFAARSGLWGGEIINQQVLATETRTSTWDVILIRAVLLPERRRWQFARDGLEFSARMDDLRFLAAIRDRTLAVPLAQGIRMRVEVRYREQFDGAVWTPVPGSHRISKVLDPLAPVPVSPLFAGSDRPEEGH